MWQMNFIIHNTFYSPIVMILYTFLNITVEFPDVFLFLIQIKAPKKYPAIYSFEKQIIMHWCRVYEQKHTRTHVFSVVKVNR